MAVLAGTPHTAKVPSAVLVAMRTLGTRSRPRSVTRLVLYCARTRAGAARGAPLALRTVPKNIPRGSSAVGAPQRASMSVAADGVASGSEIGSSVLTSSRSKLLSTPSESRKGCRKPTRYVPAGTSSIWKIPCRFDVVERMRPLLSVADNCTVAPVSTRLRTLSMISPRTRARGGVAGVVCASSGSAARASSAARTVRAF